MLGRLDHLDGDVHALMQADVGGHGHLRNADVCTRIGDIVGAGDLERLDDIVRIVLWDIVANFGVVEIGQADVDVNEGNLMTLKPAWLEVESSALEGPVSAVTGDFQATTCRNS